MNPEQRIKLNELIRTNNSVDNTPLIRELKHSSKIWEDVKKIILLKKDKEWKEIEAQCRIEAQFLYTHYTMIFNRLLRDRLDVSIFFTFLGLLREIEEGRLDQHEASYEIGMLLKRMYVDPKLDIQPTHVTGQSISWQEFKKIKLNI